MPPSLAVGSCHPQKNGKGTQQSGITNPTHHFLPTAAPRRCTAWFVRCMSSFPICSRSELRSTGQGRTAQEDGRRMELSFCPFQRFNEHLRSKKTSLRPHVSIPHFRAPSGVVSCIAMGYGSILVTLEASVSIKRFSTLSTKATLPLTAV